MSGVEADVNKNAVDCVASIYSLIIRTSNNEGRPVHGKIQGREYWPLDVTSQRFSSAPARRTLPVKPAVHRLFIYYTTN